MERSIIEKLKDAADSFENSVFIFTDPISLPHRYTEKSDIEVSAFISAWMAYGSRKVFLEKLNRLHDDMDCLGGPYQYIVNQRYLKDHHSSDDCLYRFYKWSDYLALCDRLHSTITTYGTLESTISTICNRFCGINGIPVPGSTSANKRLHMLFRWMVRKNSPVDFGIWNSISPKDLIIPLDTHVYQEALTFGLTSRHSADLKTAIEITDAMKEIWPDDPAKGDFALYGLGINH